MELRFSKEISPKTFLHVEDDAKNKLLWQDEEYKQLVMRLFSKTRWQNRNNLRLDITLSLLRGGRSSATVLKLAFVDHANNEYSLIIRSHSSEREAQEEQNNVKKLRINSADCFANFIEELNISDQYLLIYEDVSVNMGDEVQELRESLFKFWSADHKIITDKFMTFANNFHDLIEKVTKSYEGIEEGTKGINSHQHCNSILSELPPDLVINKGCLYQSENLIFKCQSAIPNEAEQAEPITKEQVLDKLSEKNKPVQWFKLSEIWLEDKDYILTGKGKIAYLAFIVKTNTKNVRIWIAVDKDRIENIESELDIEQSYQLIFLAETVTFTAQLEKMGFDSQSSLSMIEFQALCHSDTQVNLDMRHQDLHCGNVLTSGNSFKVIDVGDMKADLIASDIARLEVSLWFEMSKQLPESFSKQDAEAILKNLIENNVPDVHSLSLRNILSRFLHNLREGFKEGIRNLPDENETQLAYLIQILLYQRYCLLDGVEEIPPAFNVLASHWFSRFRDQNKIPNYVNIRKQDRIAGLRCAHFVYVAGRADELQDVKQNVNAYGYSNDWAMEWKPYWPRVKTEIVFITQTICTDQKIIHKELLLTEDLIPKIKEAKEKNNIVVLIVDPWTLKLQNYQRIMQHYDEHYDEHYFFNCTILVTFNSNDTETREKIEELQVELQRTFTQYKKTTSFSYNDLRCKLVNALRRSKDEIRMYGKRRQITGKGFTSKPTINMGN